MKQVVGKPISIPLNNGREVQVQPSGKTVFVGGPGGVVRIDPGTGNVSAKVDVPGIVHLIVLGSGQIIWALDQLHGVLYRLDLRRQQVTLSVEVPDAAYAALGGGLLWVTKRPRRGGSILRLKPETGKVVGPEIPLEQAMFVSRLGNVMWVSGGGEDAETLTRFAMGSGQKIGDPFPVTGMICKPLSRGSGRPSEGGDGARGPVFVVLERNKLLLIDRKTGAPLGAPLRTGRGLLGVMSGNGSIWALNVTDRTLTRLDAGTGQILNPAIALPAGFKPVQIAADQGGAWVLLHSKGFRRSYLVRVMNP